MSIPARKDVADIEDKDRRFHVIAPASVVVALQVEAGHRCVDAWRLGGVVIQSWIEAGCPDQIQQRTGAPK